MVDDQDRYEWVNVSSVFWTSRCLTMLTTSHVKYR